MSYQETYKKWCTDPYFDAQTQEELKNLEGNEKEIEDCFYRQLEFAREATLCLNANGIHTYLLSHFVQHRSFPLQYGNLAVLPVS